MTEFEYLAVFVSIIFGISVTHILAGTIRSFYRSESDLTHYLLTIFFFLVLILNWWTGFSWGKQEVWSFDLFLIIIIWAVSHYVAAITLYPPQSAGIEQPFEYRRNWFFWAFIGLIATDILQTAASGGLFTPWFYLPFVLHFVAACLLAIFIRAAIFHRWLAWYLVIVMTTWAFVVRRFLD